MEIDNEALLQHAIKVTEKAREVAQTRRDWEFMGYVGAALVTAGGNLYTGINVSVNCGIEFSTLRALPGVVVSSRRIESGYHGHPGGRRAAATQLAAAQLAGLFR